MDSDITMIAFLFYIFMLYRVLFVYKKHTFWNVASQTNLLKLF